MKEIRDLAIKLLGKEITLPNNDRNMIFSGEGLAGKCLEDDKLIKAEDEDSRVDNSYQTMEEHETIDNSDDDPKTPPIIEEIVNEIEPNTENEETDQKTLKKPDKILPCPRCNSMYTKFCYYNNYNVNQPRHFCKACHRYWTAGGSIRNVPVGAGRRKNKNSSSNFRQITNSEALANKVISFGPNGPFQKGVYGTEKENESACSSGSSVITTSNSIDVSKSNNFNNQIPCLQGYPWPYSPIPTLCPPGYPTPVYPIPYWVPWVPPICGTNQNLSDAKPNSPLGKHSRNGESIGRNTFVNEEFKESTSCERPILIPKTLRIDDPDEAAKSSIWATLGIKSDLINRKSIFKGFESKCDERKNCVAERPSSLRANPAAMSRSLNFVETT